MPFGRSWPERGAGPTAPDQAGHEPCVRRWWGAGATSERTAHGDLAAADVEVSGGEIGRRSQRMRAVEGATTGGWRAGWWFDGSALASPAVGALPAGVGAVDPGAPRPEDAVCGAPTHGAPPFADHVTDLVQGGRKGSVWRGSVLVVLHGEHRARNGVTSRPPRSVRSTRSPRSPRSDRPHPGGLLRAPSSITPTTVPETGPHAPARVEPQPCRTPAPNPSPAEPQPCRTPALPNRLERPRPHVRIPGDSSR
jgi:hypothetical protein